MGDPAEITLTVTVLVKNDAVTREVGRTQLALILQRMLEVAFDRAEYPWVLAADISFTADNP